MGRNLTSIQLLSRTEMASTAQDSTKTPEKMDSQLHKAVREGKIELLTSIMEGKSPPDLTLCLTPQKNTALHIAVRFGHQNIVKKMIQLQPSLISQPNSKGDTPLHMAARAGHLSLTKLLTPTSEEGALSGELGTAALRMKNMDGSTAFHEALKRGHEKVALHLVSFDQRMCELARDVNLTGESPLYLAAEAGLEEVVTKIIDKGNFSSEGPQRQTPLHIAVIKGRLGVVKILVRRASYSIQEVDNFGKTALHYASTIGQYDEVETRREILILLLQAGPSLAYVSDKNGDYPLLIATTRGPFAAVKIILDHCPDSAELVDQKGHNALHRAVIKKNDGVLKYLINRPEFKKLINERDFDGNTPMHLAAMTNNNEIVKLLLQYEGINLAATNREGLTAMDICGYKMKQHTNRDELRIHGAVPGRHQWHEQLFLPLPPPPSPPSPPPPPERPIHGVSVHPSPLPLPPSLQGIKISSDMKSVVNTLSIVTALVATITFAAAFTVPGGYRNDGPYEGEPVFIRKVALKVFLFSDTLAFSSSMAATVLLVYASAMAEDGLLFKTVLRRCSYVSGVAVLATITAFITGVYVLVPKESLWLAIIPILLGCAVPLCVVLCLMLKSRSDISGKEGKEGVGVYSVLSYV